jgi:hypothetical protein
MYFSSKILMLDKDILLPWGIRWTLHLRLCEAGSDWFQYDGTE